MKKSEKQGPGDKGAELQVLRGLLVKQQLTREKLIKAAKADHGLDPRIVGVRLVDLDMAKEVELEGDGPKQVIRLTELGHQAYKQEASTARPAPVADDEKALEGMVLEMLRKLPRTSRTLTDELERDYAVKPEATAQLLERLAGQELLAFNANRVTGRLYLTAKGEQHLAKLGKRTGPPEPGEVCELVLAWLEDGAIGEDDLVTRLRAHYSITVDQVMNLLEASNGGLLTDKRFAQDEHQWHRADQAPPLRKVEELLGPQDVQTGTGLAAPGTVDPEDLAWKAVMRVGTYGKDGCSKPQLVKFLKECGLDLDPASQLVISLVDRGQLVVGDDKRLRMGTGQPPAGAKPSHVAIREAALQHVRTTRVDYAGLMAWLQQELKLGQADAHVAACNLVADDLIEAGGALLPRAPKSDGKVPIAEAFAAGEAATTSPLVTLAPWEDYVAILAVEDELAEMRGKLTTLNGQWKYERKQAMKAVDDALHEKYGEKRAELVKDLEQGERDCKKMHDGFAKLARKNVAGAKMKEVKQAIGKGKNGAGSADQAGPKQQGIFPDAMVEQVEQSAAAAAAAKNGKNGHHAPPPEVPAWAMNIKSIGDHFNGVMGRAEDKKLGGPDALASWDEAFDDAFGRDDAATCRTIVEELDKQVKAGKVEARPDAPAQQGGQGPRAAGTNGTPASLVGAIPAPWQNREQWSLGTVPAGDDNFKSALKKATLQDLHFVLATFQGKDGHKARVAALEARQRKLEKQAQQPAGELVQA